MSGSSSNRWAWELRARSDLRFAFANWESYTPNRVRIFYLAGIVVLTVFAVLTAVGFQDTANSSGWVDHTYQAIDTIENFNNAISELESAQRGYLIAKDPLFPERLLQHPDQALL